MQLSCKSTTRRGGVKPKVDLDYVKKRATLSTKDRGDLEKAVQLLLALRDSHRLPRRDECSRQRKRATKARLCLKSI